jgi:hypothetical protein
MQIEAARRLYQDALADEEHGAYAPALSKLQRAATVKMTPSVRFHMGVCEEGLGQLVPALAHFEAAREQATAEGKAEVLRVVREPLERLRKTVPIVVLDATGSDAPERVMIDGRAIPLALLGAEIRVEIGSHRVSAERSGYSRLLTIVDSPAGSRNTVRVQLAPVSRGPDGAVDPGEASHSDEPGSNHAASKSHSWNALAISALASAAALAGFGVAAYFRADSLAGDAAATCAKTATPAPCTTDRAAIRTWDGIALGSWIGAAGLAAGGFYLYRTSF